MSSTSLCSIVRDAASEGEVASLSSTKSPRWESSSSPIGVSRETGSWETLMISRTLSGVIPISSAISPSLGSRARPSRRPGGDANQLVDRLHHVDGDPDRPGLIGDRPGDGLPDPPGGVGGELVALVV